MEDSGSVMEDLGSVKQVVVTKGLSMSDTNESSSTGSTERVMEVRVRGSVLERGVDVVGMSRVTIVVFVAVVVAESEGVVALHWTRCTLVFTQSVSSRR